jgi:hypothetical protein
MLLKLNPAATATNILVFLGFYTIQKIELQKKNLGKSDDSNGIILTHPKSSTTVNPIRLLVIHLRPALGC